MLGAPLGSEGASSGQNRRATQQPFPAEKMAQGHVGINTDYGDWDRSADAGERARLLQSPCVEMAPKRRQPPRPTATSALGAVFIVVNAALGAGLLNFPAAFSMAGGIAAGIALQMCLLVFIIGGLVILAYCSQASNERTYQEVVWAVCGKVPGVLCEVAIAVYTFGTCIAFLIIIGDQQDKIIAALVKDAAGAGASPWYTDRKFTISITACLFILPLSVPKEIGFQKYASCLSVVGTWYVTAIIIIKYIWPDQEMVPGEVPTSPLSWMSVFNAMPTICFGFQCHVSSVPVFNSMKRPELKPWGAVVTAAMVIALSVYTGTGVCGFLTFGSSVEQDVLMSYSSNDIPVAIARAFIIICVLTSYPILHFCGRAVLEGLWLRYKGEAVEEDVERERRRRLLQTASWFLLTLLLALFIPDIGKVIAMIGGLAACFIFVFPGLCLIQAKLSEIQEARPARFVESQGHPATDPVVLWLNGGPGCSSMEGFLAENGPFHMNDDGTLYLNPNSWNRVANMLYVESPAGVGYSYATSEDNPINDAQVAADNYQALQSFFAKFPNFVNHEFYVFGESYGGVYVPSLTAKIAEGSAAINLKGFGVGNGMTSASLNELTLMEFAYYHGVFGDDLWASLKENCCNGGTCNFSSNDNSDCITAISEAYGVLYGIGLNMYNLYATCWGGANYQDRYEADLSNLFRHYQFDVPVPKIGSIPGVPKCINATAMYVWLNRDDVRQALHIPSSLPNWELCSSQVRAHYQRIYTDMTPFYTSLLAKDLRALVYNGDVDMACNFLGAEQFVESLNQTVLSDYQPWYFNDQVAGFFKEYEKITFLTIKGAGHMVPQYKPGQAQKMFECFLSKATYV